MRHSWSISDFPDLPIRAFRKALGKNRPETLEGGKGGAPAAPDPYQTADAQTQLNQKTAVYNKALNLGNAANPFGQQTSHIIGQDPISGAPIYQTDVSINPALSGVYGDIFGNLGNASGQLSNAIGGLGGLQGQYGNINTGISALAPQYQALAGQLNQGQAAQAQKQGQDAAYAAQTQYLNPQFAQQQESMEAKLAAQGLAPGSQAYNNALLNFQNQKQRAYSDAANQSIMTGSQLGAQNLQNQLSGIQAQSGLLGSQANLYNQLAGNLGQQGGLFGQQAQLSQVPFSQLQSLAGLLPNASVGSAGSNPADITGAINNQYQGQLGQYNARQQSANATTSSLAGLAGMAAMMFF